MPELVRADASEATREAILDSFAGRRQLAMLHAQASEREEAALRAELSGITLHRSTMTLLSTSGSTGTPKRVELSTDAWRAHAEASNAHLGLRADDRWLVTLPLAHTGGLAIVVRCHVAGATSVIAEVPKLGEPFAAFVSAQLASVTRLSLVPAQLACLLEHDVAPRKLRSVLLGGQATMPSLAARAIHRGWPIVTSYGMTETCGMCVASPIGTVGLHVGRALSGTQLRVIDTLELRTPARATRVHGADPFTVDGWLRTQDRARLDPEGLVLLGRADDVIVSSGHKIDPLEVEAAIAALPGIRAVAVLGVPHDLHGATVAALIVGDADLEAAALASYKRPRIVRRIDALPLLPSGKVDRAAVRALLEEQSSITRTRGH